MLQFMSNHSQYNRASTPPSPGSAQPHLQLLECHSSPYHWQIPTLQQTEDLAELADDRAEPSPRQFYL